MPKDSGAGTPHTLTILRPRDHAGKLTSMAKTLVRHSDGSLTAEVGDFMPYRFQGRAHPVSGFEQFAQLLNVASEQGGCVVHGEIIPGTDTDNMRRISTPQPGRPATIRDRIAPYLVLDIDSLPLPEGMSVEKDPEEIVRFALGRIGALTDVSAWYHFSHSAGTTPKAGSTPKVKLHLAFWLGDQGMSCRDLERWVKYQNEFAGAKLLDPAPYSPADFIFLGNPKLAPGAVDPVPAGKRYGVILGKHDTPYLDVPDTWKPEGERRSRDQQIIGSGAGVKGVAGALRRLGDECHGAIFAAAGAAFRARELAVDDAALEERIERAFRATVWGPDRTAAYLRAAETDIPRVVKWWRDATLETVQTTPYGVPAPRFPNADPAITALGEALDRFFVRVGKQHDAVIAAIGNESAVIPPPPLMAVKATTGVGKTRGVVARLLDSPCHTILYAAPTHAVLEEIREALERENAKRPGEYVAIIHIYGRTHTDSRTKEPTMCKRAGVSEQVRRAGGDTSKLCHDFATGSKCPHFDACPFIKQRDLLDVVERAEARAIYLMAVDTLPHRLPGGVRTPDLVVIDESFWASLKNEGKPSPHLKLETMRGIKWQVLEDVKFGGELIRQAMAPAPTAELATLWQRFTAMLEACEEQADGTGYFPPSAITLSAKEMDKLATLLNKCRVNVDLDIGGSGHNDAAVTKALGKVGEVNSRVDVFRGLLKVLQVEAVKTVATKTGQVSVREGQVRFRRAREPNALGKWETIPTLFLDADLDPELVRRWWPGLRDEDVVDITCGWSPHVKVVQVRGTSFSKGWAVGYGDDATDAKRVAKHQEDLDAFIRHAMAANSAAPSETMIISYQKVIEALGARFKDDDLYAVPENPAAWRSVGWFNALAGMDRWKEVKVGFVIGRPQAQVDDYSDMARALWGHEDRDWSDVEPNGQGFKKAPVKRYRVHTKDDAMPATTWAQVMPDERCERIYRQVTWGQAMQADGRIRPVHRTADKPCVLFVLGEVPRGMQVDEVVFWEDMIVDRFDRAVARAAAAGGVVPSSPGGLARFAPDLWKDADAVQKDCRLREDGDEVSISLPDRLEGVVRKLAILAGDKHPPHAIRLSHSTWGVLSDESGAPTPPPDGPSGQLNLRRVPGSPLSWLRVPTSAPAILSEALTAAFGPIISKVSVAGGEWLSFADLQHAEAQYATAILAAELRRRKAEQVWVIRGAEQDGDFPEPMNPRAKFRHRAGLGRVTRARRTDDLAALHLYTAEAMLWQLGETPACERWHAQQGSSGSKVL